MATQNLISATIAPEAKEDILAKLADIRSKLTFLMSLKAGDIQSLIKVGNNYAPFLDKSAATLKAHPEIMHQSFNAEEFRKDYQLGKDLAPIVDQINELAVSLENTLTAANSDAMVGALEIYRAVKDQSDRIPGLTLVSEEMSAFFKKPHHKTAAAKA